MFDLTTLAVFAAASLTISLMPGPAMLYIIARSASQGRLAGLVSVLGLGVGGLAHVIAAGLGLSALLMSSALAFNVLKYLGAAYLIWLGLRTLLARPKAEEPCRMRAEPLGRIFFQGCLVELLNPKTALFYLAFLPQFTDPARGSVAAQAILLGLVFVVLAVLADGAYALTAATAGRLLAGKRHVVTGGRWIAGGVYLGLGALTAVSGSGKE
ncbi:LysE family translocator [Desulfocurvibacter africanus]|uniref:LysE family translocator n=1 Tax=Desulfocurvibacter africanus TaxID=873 RepID=UPI002FD993A4